MPYNYFTNSVIDAEESALIGIWPFDQSPNDLAGSRNFGIGGGAPSWDTGRFADCWNTAGFPYNFSQDGFPYPVNSFIISVWVKNRYSNTSNGPVLMFPDHLPFLTVGLNDDYSWFGDLIDGNLNQITLLAKAGSNTWQHLVFAGVGDQLYFFLNKKLVSTKAWDGTFKEWDGDQINAGLYAEFIDSLAVWYDMSTVTEIGALRDFVDELYTSFPIWTTLSESLGLSEVNTGGLVVIHTVNPTLAFSDNDTGLLSMSSQNDEAFSVADDPLFMWNHIVYEELGLSPESLSGLSAIGNISETMTLIDELRWGWLKTIAESVSFTDVPTWVLGVISKEWLSIAEALTCNWDGSVTNIETILLIDEEKAWRIYAEAISEGLSIADSLERLLDVLIDERMTISDSLLASGQFQVIYEESLKVAADLVITWVKSVSESISFSDTLATTVSLMIREWLKMEEITSSSWNGTERIIESLMIGDDDRAAKMFIELVAEGISVSDALSQVIAVIIQDSIAFVGSMLAAGTFKGSVSESMNLLDSTVWAWAKKIEESLGLADAQSSIWTAVCSLAESIAVSDSGTPTRTTYASLSESLQTTIAAAMQVTLYGFISDRIGIGEQLYLGGDVYQCWALNTGDFHPSVYSGFDFNSFAEYNGNTYGAKSDGIYLISDSSETDNGSEIHPGIKLPATTFGASNQKRLRRAWFGLAGGNPSIRVETEHGSKTYNVVSNRADLSRDIHGQIFTVEIQDFNSLDFIELIPILLNRRQG